MSNPPEIIHYKQLVLGTLEVNIIELPACNPPLSYTQVVQVIAALNATPLVYGVVYYLDRECFQLANPTNP